MPVKLTRLYLGNLPYGLTERQLDAWLTAAEVSWRRFTISTDQEHGRQVGLAWLYVAPGSESRTLRRLHDRNFNGRAAVCLRAIDSHD